MSECKVMLFRQVPLGGIVKDRYYGLTEYVKVGEFVLEDGDEINAISADADAKLFCSCDSDRVKCYPNARLVSIGAEDDE